MADNVPDYLQTANTPNDDGFFSRDGRFTPRQPRHRQKQYDLNGNVGGPLWKQKAWFFTSWRLNDQYKYIAGLGDTHAALEADEQVHVQGHVPGRQEQPDHRLPEQAREAAGQARHQPDDAALGRLLPELAQLSVEGRSGPACSAAARSSTCSYGNWYNFFPLRPVRDYGLYDGPWDAGRARTPPTGRSVDGGGNNGYQDQKRYKPQFYITLSYFKDGWKGSHDFKVGFDWKRDRRSLFNDQPFDIFYRDNNGALSAGRHLQLVGHRHQRRRLHRRLDQRHVEGHQPPDPEPRRALRELQGRVAGPGARAQRHPGAGRAGPIRATRSFIAPRTSSRDDRGQHQRRSRRSVGFAYDLTGDNRTVLKGFIGQSRWNSADTLADQENPVGLAQLRYAFVSCSATRHDQLRPERQPPRRQARRTRRVQLDAGRRRLRARRPRPEPPDQQRDVDRTSSAKSRTGLSGRAS